MPNFTEYHWKHYRASELIASGQFKAISWAEAKRNALMDSGLDKVDAWLFNRWYDSPLGAVQFKHYGSDNWMARMTQPNVEFIAVFKPKDEPILLSHFQPNQPTQLELELV